MPLGEGRPAEAVPVLRRQRPDRGGRRSLSSHHRGHVAVRYFTNQSIAWTEEISVHLMVVVALAGSAAAAMRDQHIRVAAVCESGSEAKRLRLALLSSGLSTLLFGALTALRWLVRDELLLETSAALRLPCWWYTASLTVLAGALTMRSAVWGLRRIRSSRVQLPAQELP
ncbi:MAG: TRAP transporter small permease [Ideonella sp.]|nr:TRAP transporter small permease [Ideonella sp.]